MIELFLSSDGKHTVHISAETVEEFAKLAPQAQALYEKVLERYGTKAQMWQTAIPVAGHGEAKVGKRIDTVAEAREAIAPRCPMHDTPMVYRQGRFGSFWSCPVRKPDGRWCQVTKDIAKPANGEALSPSN